MILPGYDTAREAELEFIFPATENRLVSLGLVTVISMVFAISKGVVISSRYSSEDILTVPEI